MVCDIIYLNKRTRKEVLTTRKERGAEGRDEVAILIPCCNEETTIGKVVGAFSREMPEAKIYVYDNNSTDKSVERAIAEGAEVRYEKRQGKGNVVRTMFRDVDADIYVMVDADDTYAAEDARKMVEKVKEGVDMVIGDRLSSTYFTENKRFGHNFGNRIVRGAINRLFKANIGDAMTGYRAFSRRFVKTFPVCSDGFEIETEMTIHALDKKMNLVSLPIHYKDRPQGSQSKLNTYSDGVKVCMTIFNMIREYRPLFFFAICSLALLVLSALLGIPVLVEFFNTGLVSRFPTLIVSTILLVLAFLFFSTGLVLDIIAKKHRQIFEVMIMNEGGWRRG